jgi:hypothetical protein
MVSSLAVSNSCACDSPHPAFIILPGKIFGLSFSLVMAMVFMFLPLELLIPPNPRILSDPEYKDRY